MSKTVKIEDKHWLCKDTVWCDWYECPNCDSTMIIAKSSYCSDCGIKLKWDVSGDKEVV